MWQSAFNIQAQHTICMYLVAEVLFMPDFY